MSMTGNLRRRKKIARERERNNNYASKFIIYLFVYEPPVYEFHRYANQQKQ
jgi:hypothetical protein